MIGCPFDATKPNELGNFVKAIHALTKIREMKRRKEMEPDKELKVMESKVRAAMETCPQAKAALEKIFGGQLKFADPEVGDIVMGIGTQDEREINGKLGIIKDTESSAGSGIEFFEGGFRTAPGVRPGHYWFVFNEKIKLVYRPSK